MFILWMLIFGHYDGTVIKQGMRRELCGVAFIYFFAKPVRLLKKLK